MIKELKPLFYIVIFVAIYEVTSLFGANIGSLIGAFVGMFAGPVGIISGEILGALIDYFII